MKKFFLLAAPVVAASLATPAAAQPSGARIEGIVGYDRVKIDPDGAGAAARDSIQGVLYGVGVGYDFPLGPSLGVGADVEYTDTSTDRNLPTSTFTVRRDIFVGGRLTAAVSNSFNVYGRLGYTSMQTRLRPDATTALTVSDTHGGVRGALGVQFVDESRSFYGVELRYSDYGNDVSRRQAAVVIGTRF